MAVDLMSDRWAEAVQGVVESWPDAAEQANPRKTEAYWKYVAGKRQSFNGTFAFAIRGVPGITPDRFLALTFDETGACTAGRIVDSAEVAASARIAMECQFGDWVDIVNGYDIGKAMTYHKLPLVKGVSTELLRFAYLVHEVLVAITRVETTQTEPVPA